MGRLTKLWARRWHGGIKVNTIIITTLDPLFKAPTFKGSLSTTTPKCVRPHIDAKGVQVMDHVVETPHWSLKQLNWAINVHFKPHITILNYFLGHYSSQMCCTLSVKNISNFSTLSLAYDGPPLQNWIVLNLSIVAPWLVHAPRNEFLCILKK